MYDVPYIQLSYHFNKYNNSKTWQKIQRNNPILLISTHWNRKCYRYFGKKKKNLLYRRIYFIVYI